MLFQKNIIKKYFSALDNGDVQNAWEIFKKYFLDADIQNNIRLSKEEQFQEGFLRELFVNVLGYTLNPSPNFNLITEQKNLTNAKKADGAIVINNKIVGVIELKDHKTTDLSKIEAQAFGYKNQHPNARYVIISNFEKLRLYIDNAVDFREWNLFNIGFDDFRELFLLLSYQNVVGNIAVKAKEESVSTEDQITNALYKDYSEFKKVLYEDICGSGSGSNKGACPLVDADLYKKTQKLLDRFLFIFFAEDCGLLPPNTMMRIIADWKKLAELDAYVPLYDRIKKYFNYLDTGYKGKDFEIFAYNGGLFKPDTELDSLKISDSVLEKYTAKLSAYDYESDVDVNILGHIFENSLSETQGHAPVSNIGIRKRDGVFYTPQYITKYIVQNTVGRLCDEQKEKLGIVEAEYFADIKRRKDTAKALMQKLADYRKWLLGISILDPACGSGAFLNAALKFLIDEHRLIDEMEAKITGASLVMPNIENSILENNLFGVDINEESVEIAKLSLWLRTARPRRKLNNLNQNIKCGNSLISDPAIAGDKAFDWHKEFPNVFANGGFDVVIGNPPYVQLQNLGNMSDNYAKCGYQSYNKSADLYCLFAERGYNLLKKGGLQSFIMPNKWMLVDYGKELRQFLSKTAMQQIINFGDVQFFQDATIYVCIFVTRKSAVKGNVLAASFNKKTYHGDFPGEVPAALQEFEPATFAEEPWIIRDATHSKILDKMSQNGIKLKDLPIEIYRGVLTGYNDAFFIDGQTRNRLIADDPKSADLIKPLLRGRDITVWNTENADLYLINPHNGDKEKGIPPVNIEEYPALKKHLDQFIEKLKKRGDKGDTPYNLRNCAYLDEFSKPKIVYPNMTSAFPFSYDESGSVCNDKAFIITSKDENFPLKELLAMLNSKLTKLWIWYNCPELQGGTREIRKAYFENFPVPKELLSNDNDADTTTTRGHAFFSTRGHAPLSVATDRMLALHSALQNKVGKFLHRIAESYNLTKTTQNLEQFYNLDFKAFAKELEKQKIKLTLLQKDELEEYFNAYKAECLALKSQIEATDNEINQMVCELYGLSDEEIAMINEKVSNSD